MQTIIDSCDERRIEAINPDNNRCKPLAQQQGQESVGVRNTNVESNQEYYVLIVELRNASNLSHLGNVGGDSRVWISYEFLGMVVQSDQFICSTTETHFPIKRDRFFWNGNCPSEIQIYICAKERVLGVANVQIKSIFFDVVGTKGLLGKKEIVSKVNPIYPGDDVPRDLLHPDPHIQIMIECTVFDDSNTILSYPHRDELSKNNSPDPLLQILPKPFMEPLTCKVEEHIYGVAKQLSDAKIDIERKQKEWNVFFQREENKFRNHLKEKEEKVRNYLNLKIQKNQEEHSRTLELCRVEYRNLEARLKKSLREVEAKEREMDRRLEEKEAILKKKLTELDVKEKMLREEAQHLVDMEAVKLQTALQKIAILEKDKEAIVRLLEEEKKRFTDSEENKMKEEVSRLRCRIIELESQLTREIAEKKILASDQDRYRIAAHKLAKLIRQERAMNNHNEERGHTDDSNGMKRSEKLREIKSKLVALVSSNQSNDT
mmetsp:Transcript_1128/g.2049  ORF Transcript_1128/g.2049 Transcript_1128/m.2049 type:complete len:489 (-) Transcript_1128:1372-2838(-)